MCLLFTVVSQISELLLINESVVVINLGIVYVMMKKINISFASLLMLSGMKSLQFGFDYKFSLTLLACNNKQLETVKPVMFITVGSLASFEDFLTFFGGRTVNTRILGVKNHLQV